MTNDEYQKIKNYCKKKLVYNLHDRHLEDLTQYVAMTIFEKRGGYCNWEYIVIDYLRLNGIGNGQKIDKSQVINEISCEYNDQITHEDQKEDTRNDILQDFLEDFNFEKKDMDFILEYYGKYKRTKLCQINNRLKQSKKPMTLSLIPKLKDRILSI